MEENQYRIELTFLTSDECTLRDLETLATSLMNKLKEQLPEFGISTSNVAIDFDRIWSEN